MIEDNKPTYRIVGRYGSQLVRNRRVNYNYMPKGVTRDNQGSFNVKSTLGGYTAIRVPSLKRSDRTWRKFYNLFPSLRGEKSFRGCKLKQLK